MTTTPHRPAGLLTIALCALLGLAVLTGCDTKTAAAPTPVALAVVVSPHANAPKPMLVDSMRAAISSAVASHGYVTIVINDGRPSLIEGGGANVGSDARTRRMAEQADARQTQSLAALLTAQVANAPENAPLQALGLAARDLAGRGGERRIVIQDSGLQTVAPISFTAEGQLASDPKEVADFLAAKHELPDLTGIAITWSGLGDTAPPQQSLDQASRGNLRAIWQAVIEKAGGAVTFVESPLTEPPAAGLPAVTEVPVPEPVQIPATCTPKEVFLRNSDVRFDGDVETYADPPAVRRLLEPYAARIVADGLSVHLIGTTASSDNKAFIARLSKNRAAAVAATLRELGVPASAITTEGQGMLDKWHVADRDPSGNLIPRLAERNRKVVLLISGTSGC